MLIKYNPHDSRVQIIFPEQEYIFILSSYQEFRKPKYQIMVFR